MYSRNITLLFALLVVLAGCGRTGDTAIVIIDAWARPASAQRPPAVSAVYMMIENNTQTDDFLLRVESDVSAVAEVHQTTIDNDIARMRPVDGGLLLPAKTTVRLDPGGTHVMLVQIQHDLEVGDRFAIRLVFASGEIVTVDVPVREQES